MVIQALKDPCWIEAKQEEASSSSLQHDGPWWIYHMAKEPLVLNGCKGTRKMKEAYASFKDFVVYQMDVKSAFLYGKIEEEVYVYQLPRFEDPEFPDRVYKVENALYGLYQAPRALYETLSTYLLDNGFQRGLQVTQKDDGIFISQDKLMIGSLMYLTSSRPDTMFDVCACARFQVTPKVSHLHAVKRIFRYLKGQPKLGLWYPKDSPFDLEAYTNSDYVGASLDRKSTIGGCQFLGSRLISWQCKKQTVVANSTTKILICGCC
ncbi:putative ribonuclease H-like domain-containing protein [Tanacetum coccineum]